MAVALIEKVAFSGIAALVAAIAGFGSNEPAGPKPAYFESAAKLEAAAAALHAGRVFERADLNNDGALDRDEYAILAIVSAELAHLNGFVAIDAGAGVKTVALRSDGKASITPEFRSKLRDRSDREFALIAGDDERMESAEFVGANLEQFLASDADRNGVLAGIELTSFAAAQSRLPSLVG